MFCYFWRWRYFSELFQWGLSWKAGIALIRVSQENAKRYCFTSKLQNKATLRELYWWLAQSAQNSFSTSTESSSPHCNPYKSSSNDDHNRGNQARSHFLIVVPVFPNHPANQPTNQHPLLWLASVRPSVTYSSSMSQCHNVIMSQFHNVTMS